MRISIYNKKSPTLWTLVGKNERSPYNVEPTTD